jgi:lipopolysaccharide transport system ATP-binding protein
VGDAEFQKKCLGKMEEVSTREGRTILFVSHNLSVVQTLCEKGIYLKAGQIAAAGSIDDLVSAYIREQHQKENNREPISFGRIRVNQIKTTPSTIRSGDRLSVEVSWLAVQNCSIIGGALLLYNSAGVRVGIIDLRSKLVYKKMTEGECMFINIDINRVNLIEGTYSLGLYLNTTDRSGDIYDLASVTIEEQNQDTGIAPYEQRYRGLVNFHFEIH